MGPGNGAVMQQVVLQMWPHEVKDGSPPINPVPANALLAEDGTPILNENGEYILVEDEEDTGPFDTTFDETF